MRLDLAALEIGWGPPKVCATKLRAHMRRRSLRDGGSLLRSSVGAILRKD